MADRDELAQCQQDLAKCHEQNALAESLLGEFESKYNSLSTEHSAVVQASNQAVAANQELQRKISLLQSQLEKHSSASDGAASAEYSHQLALARAREEKEHAQSLADMRQQEIDRLHTELHERTKRLEAATAREAALATEVASVRAASEPEKLKSERLAAQLNLAQDRAAFLSAELESRTKEVGEERSKAATRTAELQTELASSRSLCDHHARSQASCTMELEALREAHVSLSNELQAAQALAARTADQAKRETNALRRVSESQARLASESSSRVTELEGALAALQQEAQAAMDGLAAQARAEESAAAAAHAGEVQALRTAISTLESRVHALDSALSTADARAAELAARASDTPAGRVLAALEADAAAGPTATSTALELMRRSSASASSSSSASAMYARLEVTESALCSERQETSRLRSYLTSILSEIELKAPLIAQQRKDYERVLVSHEELSSRLSEAMRVAYAAQAEAGREAEEGARAARELEVARKLSEDQASQIRVLVSERMKDKRELMLDAAGGGSNLSLSHSAEQGTEEGKVSHVGEGWPQDDGEFMALAASAQGGQHDILAILDSLVTEHLVTFTDVSQLQSRNAQLLRLVRRLAKGAAKHGLLVDLLGSGRDGNTSGSSPGQHLSLSSLGSSSSTGQTSMHAGAEEAIKGVMADLLELRAARERQGAVVSGLVQQRDLYRLLLAQVDGAALRQADAAARAVHGGGGIGGLGMSGVGIGGTPAAPRTGMGSPEGVDDGTQRLSASSLGASMGAMSVSMVAGQGSEVSALQAALASTTARLADAERRAQSAIEQADVVRGVAEAARREGGAAREEAAAAHRAANEADAALRTEIADLRAHAAHADADAKFQASRVALLGASLTSAREDATREMKRVSDLQELLVRHQHELSTRDTALHTTRQEIVQLRSAVATAEAQAGVMTASVGRLQDALAVAGEERERAFKTAESLRSIEASIAASTSADRQGLQEDRARLQREWTDARKALEDERALSASKEAAAAGRLRDAVKRWEDCAAALSAAHSEAAAAKAEAEGLRAQVHILNEQSADLRSKVGGRVAALGARGDVDAGRLASLEVQVANLTSELQAARETASRKDAHVVEYKRIASAAEEALSTVQASIEAARAEAMGQAAGAVQEAERLRARVGELEDALGAEKAASSASTASAYEREDALRSALSSAQAAAKEAGARAEAAAARQASLEADLKALQALQSTSRARYDSELVAHADEAKARAATQREADELRERLAAAEDGASALQAQLITAGAEWSVREAALLFQAQASSTALAELKEQDALLHNQLAVLHAAVKASHGEGAEGEGAGKYAQDGQLVQLREALVYLRRTQESAEARAELAEARASGLEDRVRAAQRGEDEARAAARQAQGVLDELTGGGAGAGSGKAGTPGKASRLLSAEEHAAHMELRRQHALLSESNEHLREAERRAAARAEAAERSAAQLEAAGEPAKAALASLRATIAALEAQRASLQETIALWQGRYAAVLDKADAVDPAQHRALQAELAGLKAAAEGAASESTRASASALETERSRAEEGLAHAQAAWAGEKKDLEERLAKSEERGNKLRDGGLNWKKKYDDALRTANELRAEVEGARTALAEATAIAAASKEGAVDAAEVARVQAQLSEAQAALAACTKQLAEAASARVAADALTASLRAQVKATAESSNKRYKDLRAQFDELARSKAAAATSAPAPAPAPAPASDENMESAIAAQSHTHAVASPDMPFRSLKTPVASNAGEESVAVAAAAGLKFGEGTPRLPAIATTTKLKPVSPMVEAASIPAPVPAAVPAPEPASEASVATAVESVPAHGPEPADVTPTPAPAPVPAPATDAADARAAALRAQLIASRGRGRGGARGALTGRGGRGGASTGSPRGDAPTTAVEVAAPAPEAAAAAFPAPTPPIIPAQASRPPSPAPASAPVPVPGADFEERRKKRQERFAAVAAAAAASLAAGSTPAPAPVPAPVSLPPPSASAGIKRKLSSEEGEEDVEGGGPAVAETGGRSAKIAKTDAAVFSPAHAEVEVEAPAPAAPASVIAEAEDEEAIDADVEADEGGEVDEVEDIDQEVEEIDEDEVDSDDDDDDEAEFAEGQIQGDELGE